MRRVCVAWVVLALSGCATPAGPSAGTGPEIDCGTPNVEFAFSLPGIYAALANGTSTAPDPDQALPFDATALPPAYHDGILTRVTWLGSDRALMRGLFMRYEGAGRLTLQASLTTANATIRSSAETLIDGLTGWHEPQRRSAVDALLANGSISGYGRNDTTGKMDPTLTTYEMSLEGPLALDALFANSTPQDTHASPAAFKADQWTFEFWLPGRSATSRSDHLTVSLGADPRDVASARVYGTWAVDEAANATAAVLASRGLRAPREMPGNPGPIC